MTLKEVCYWHDAEKRYVLLNLDEISEMDEMRRSVRMTSGKEYRITVECFGKLKAALAFRGDIDDMTRLLAN